jgi:hypothetical protein
MLDPQSKTQDDTSFKLGRNSLGTKNQQSSVWFLCNIFFEGIAEEIV